MNIPLHHLMYKIMYKSRVPDPYLVQLSYAIHIQITLHSPILHPR